MATHIKDIIDNTKQLTMTESALSTLMDIERVLDELDIYVFANWKLGELVQGPKYEKYFVTTTFMWPYKKMPDPRGAERMLDYKCEVYFKKDMLEYPGKIYSPDDFEPGGKMPKMKKTKVWLVTIVMPKSLMNDINQGSLEIESGVLDMEDIDQAYEEETDDANAVEESGTVENAPEEEPNNEMA